MGPRKLGMTTVLEEVHVRVFLVVSVDPTLTLLTVVTSLTTQRNAVAMLHERMRVLLKYIVGVINGKHLRFPRYELQLKWVFTGTAQVDHAVLRQISAIVSTLPVMTESGFQDEFLTVSLTSLACGARAESAAYLGIL